MVLIDTVYQRVLALANKEQRGYITPQDFNLFANLAQMEIFEQYFYDLNQFSRIHGNDTVYSDMVSLLEEKIQMFEEYMTPVNTNPFIDAADSTGKTYLLNTFPLIDVYRFDQLHLNDKRVEILNNKDFNRFSRFNTNDAPLYKATTNRPVATISKSLTDTDFRQISLSHAGSLAISYIRVPTRVNWGFTAIGTDSFYDPTISNNFELHESEQAELTYRILVLAGVSIQKQDVTQVAAGMQGAAVQQEKK